MTDPVRLSLDEVHAMAAAACTHHGCSAAQAEAIADTLTAAERDACQAHGLFRVPFYIKAIANSGVVATAEPAVSQPAPAILRVDGGLGFAPLALQRGCDALAGHAHSQGIAALGVTNVFHIAALWPEVERLAAQGLVAFAFTGAIDYVAPAGGSAPLYGTNPMAFAWPRKDQPPVVFDQASSASARGEIQLARREGRSLPEGWAVGPDGQPTTDPATALAGAQLPFGGHKGSSIALMVELLAGALIGDLFSYQAGEHDSEGVGAPRGGEFIIAIDPAHCGGDGDRAARLGQAETLFARLLAQDGTRLPGERRFRAREQTRTHGVAIPRPLYDQVQGLIHARG